MKDAGPVVGIDLGTTNSEIAAWLEDRIQVLGPGTTRILPSCVGISPAGELLVGEAARNQQILFPERTVRSVKRKMGSDETIVLGDKTFTPPEISALILRALVEWAGQQLAGPVKRAVVTVPAYFSDAERQATRQAGELCGLEVLRILNEPTAASLAYGYGDDRRRTVMVYDLGGGTFDVSVVSLEGEVTEVLASHGNNRLGGDDFDQLLVERLLEEFEGRHRIDLRDGHPAACWRLVWAAEEAKKKLSSVPYATIREENLVSVRGKPRHLELEIGREEYEEMIRPLVESTLDSVSKAMDDAGKRPSDLDAVLLVGGSTRTPLVSRILEKHTRMVPSQEVHPDLCVALGAGVLASRLAGREVERVLVDVSPYSFGPSYLGELDGVPYAHCYRPIIRRNTPLPVTRTESYWTVRPYQREVDVQIFQGDEPDALKNILVGEFRVKELKPLSEENEILCRMQLDIDGILRVTATEKRTGKSKEITIAQALRQLTDEEIATARERLEELCSGGFGEADAMFGDADDEEAWEGEAAVMGSRELGDDAGEAADEAEGPEDPVLTKAIRQAQRTAERSRALLATMHDDDKEEAINLHEAIEKAIAARDLRALTEATADLDELLFFVEGR
ncbi:MAG: Hsp70 family protein [bacterium]|nr:Hsp70 family protein [bacterium]